MTNAELPVFNAVKVVQALYNQKCNAMVTLDVNGDLFHVHRVVLVPICGYLERILQWPNAETECPQSVSETVARICLPELLVPDYYRDDSKQYDTKFWFDRFLRVVYGLQGIDDKNPVEIFIMVEIADYLICELMLKECDEVLSKMEWNRENVLDVTLFCQKFSLPKTFDAVKKVIPHHWFDLRRNPKLYCIEKDHFREMMMLPPESRCGQFFVLFRYVTEQNSCPAPDINHQIKDAEMRKLFQDVLSESSPDWHQSVLDSIFSFFEESPSEPRLNNNIEDIEFLLKTFSIWYRRAFGPHSG